MIPALDYESGDDQNQHGWVLGGVDEGGGQEIRVAWLPATPGKLATVSLRVWRRRDGGTYLRGIGLDIRTRHLREVIALLTAAADLAEASDPLDPK